GCVSDSGGDARVGHWGDNIRVHGMLARQQTAKVLARFLYRTAEDDRIWAREINVLENTMRVLANRSVAFARQAPGAHRDRLAGIHVAQIHRADQVEGAGFGCEYIGHAVAGKFHLAERQRTESLRVARDDDAILG